MKQTADDNRYVITLNHRQLRALERALDLFACVGIGQLETVLEHLESQRPKQLYSLDERQHILDDFIAPIKKKLLGLAPRASLGISNDAVPNIVKVARDMMKVIQKTIAAEEKHNRGSVWHDGDILRLGSEPSASVAKIESAQPEDPTNELSTEQQD